MQKEDLKLPIPRINTSPLEWLSAALFLGIALSVINPVWSGIYRSRTFSGMTEIFSETQIFLILIFASFTQSTSIFSKSFFSRMISSFFSTLIWSLLATSATVSFTPSLLVPIFWILAGSQFFVYINIFIQKR